MKISRRNTFERIRGFTLVELMIGMIVSMIIVLGMVGIYRSVAHNAAEVSLGTKIDNQVFTGMLAVDRILQGAGFGLPPEAIAPLNNQFAVTANSVIWYAVSFADPLHSYKKYCNALISDGDGLYYYGPLNGFPGYVCNTLAPPSAIQPINLVQLPDVDAMKLVGKFKFEVSNASTPCFPLGVAGTSQGGAYLLTVTATVFAASDLGSGSARDVKNTVCMFNFK